MDVRKDTKIFKTLLEAPSPSGMEEPATKIWTGSMEQLRDVYHYYDDKIGNVGFSIGNGEKKILLSGHIDEVQARVTNISKDGIISIMSTGGICKKSLVASHVNIIADEGYLVEGIVEKKAIHCEEKDEADKVEDIYKMRINIGATSDEEVEEDYGVHVGSPVIYARNTNMEFGANQICSQGLDDKVGVFITYEIMKALSKEKSVDFFNKYTVIGLATTQEETGLRGASVAASSINPDISIDFDVTFATDGGINLDKGKYGDIKLGNGGVIQYGPDKSERLNSILINNATVYQRGVSRAGGTNTNAIQLRSKDCETTLVSIPNRNMHTPIEVVDWRDIQSIVDMVSNSIINCQL